MLPDKMEGHPTASLRGGAEPRVRVPTPARCRSGPTRGLPAHISAPGSARPASFQVREVSEVRRSSSAHRPGRRCPSREGRPAYLGDSSGSPQRGGADKRKNGLRALVCRGHSNPGHVATMVIKSWRGGGGVTIPAQANWSCNPRHQDALGFKNPASARGDEALRTRDWTSSFRPSVLTPRFTEGSFLLTTDSVLGQLRATSTSRHSSHLPVS